MFTEIDIVIQKLKDSPLFYLFLSSRELFHTNFWYWLSTLNNTEALKLFSGNIYGKDELVFKREHNQSSSTYKSKVDLLISYHGNPSVVIENKVKDFPTISQLQRIKDSFNNESLQYIVTTLFYSPEIVFEGWKVKTYRDISDAVIPENFTQNEYYRNLIQDYKEFTYNLSELARLLPLTMEYDFAISFDNDLYTKLNDIKLWEGYQKLRASHLLYHFNKYFNQPLGIETRYSINNQKATIDFLIFLKAGYLIGISLEGNQLRKQVGGNKPLEFAENLLNNQIFFSDDFMGRGKKPFLKYDNKGDTQYRYQYEKISIAPSFQDLFDKIHFVMSEVTEQRDLIESCIPTNL